MISCPSCLSSMAEKSHAGLKLDHCAQCSGIWFDHSELESYLNKMRTSGEEGLPVQLPGSPGLPGHATACPRCRALKLIRRDIQDLEIQQCFACGGVFLERSAVSQILIRERPLAPQESGSGPGDNDSLLRLLEVLPEILGNASGS